MGSDHVTTLIAYSNSFITFTSTFYNNLVERKNLLDYSENFGFYDIYLHKSLCLFMVCNGKSKMNSYICKSKMNLKIESKSISNVK